MSRKAVRLIVTGRVQGVWFRAHTQREARALGLVGTVRNLPDGSVEIVAEGSAAAVDRLVDWSWKGSPSSSVAHVEVEDEPVVGLFSTFEIEY